jgi:hypothetical protein
MTFIFTQYRNKRITLRAGAVEIGGVHMQMNETLDCGPLIGCVAVRDIARVAEEHARLSGGTCYAQLAALVFDATGEPRALDWYFPLINALSEREIADFYDLVRRTLQRRELDLRLFGEGRRDLTSQMPSDISAIVAGHLAEIFFYRQDILDRLLAAPRHIWLYTTPAAYKADGGVAGGCYSSSRGCVQMVLSRLYEGFNGDIPGAAPFLHEFGHMLDFFDAASCAQGQSLGLFPGLSPNDGAIYTPQARELFIQGKRLELERYLRRYDGIHTDGDPIPVGHPYVFQNDTEFAAGYFEMFFRNPNYFATLNPTLYQAFVELFGQDPRRAWKQDFSHYVNDNRAFYLQSGERPWATRVTVPE